MALLLVNEFFTRSACFRAMLIDEFQVRLSRVVLVLLLACLRCGADHHTTLHGAHTTPTQNFLELVVGTKVYKPLPPPSERAVQLRQKGLEFIENWHEQYGHANKQVILTSMPCAVSCVLCVACVSSDLFWNAPNDNSCAWVTTT